MIITSRLQQVYRDQLSQLEDNAAQYVQSYISALHSLVPEVSVADIREAAKEAIDSALNVFGDQAGVLACEMFDEIVRREGIKATSELYDTIDREKTDSKVRYFARKLVDGDLPAFTKNVTDLTRFYVKRSAFENMVRNCTKNDVRYARIPSGRETCSFCFMLSSRGFVYQSEEAARGSSLHGVHQHCDCIIVPGVEGVTKIEGYDPNLMYERWKKCADTVNIDPDIKSDSKRKAIMKEVSTRDWKWLYSDDRNYSSEISYLKPREALTENERVGIDHLAANGIKAIVNYEDQEAPANIDLTINGKLWEMKNAGDGKHSIEDHMREARSKWRRLGLSEPMKVVITTEGRTKGFLSAIEEVTKRLRKNEEALVVGVKENMVRIQK